MLVWIVIVTVIVKFGLHTILKVVVEVSELTVETIIERNDSWIVWPDVLLVFVDRSGRVVELISVVIVVATCFGVIGEF